MASGLLNENQAAEHLRLKPRALQSWRTRGGGPPYLRIGHRTVRYSLADLEVWLESRRFENTGQEERYGSPKAALDPEPAPAPLTRFRRAGGGPVR